MKNLTNIRFIFIITFCFLMTLLPLFNYLIDQMGVLNGRTQLVRDGIEPNKHFLKMKYVIENKNKYSCFMFGSSRVGYINISKYSKKCYNFSYSRGLPFEHLQNIKTLLHNGVSLRKVYIGLDDFSYGSNPSLHYEDYLRRRYPDTILEWIKLYKFYLYKKPTKRDFEILLNSKHQLIKSNIITENDIENRIIRTNNRLSTIEPNKKISKINGLGGERNRISKTIEEIKQLLLLSRIHKFELVVFFNPLHYKTLFVNDIDKMKEFKRELANVTNFYDFSGFNQYSTNNKYWFETSHYTLFVGDLMLANMTQKNDSNNFGKYVNAENIRHLEKNIYNIKPYLVKMKDQLKELRIDNISSFMKSNIYTEKYINFDGKTNIKKKLNINSNEYSFEILLKSNSPLGQEFAYTKSSPPMPLLIRPIAIYQVGNNKYRITVSCKKPIDVYISDILEWRHIAVRVDKNRQGMILIDGYPISKGKYCDSLGRDITIGKGLMDRYWQGSISYIKITNNIKKSKKSKNFEKLTLDGSELFVLQ